MISFGQIFFIATICASLLQVAVSECSLKEPKTVVCVNGITKEYLKADAKEKKKVESIIFKGTFKDLSLDEETFKDFDNVKKLVFDKAGIHSIKQGTFKPLKNLEIFINKNTKFLNGPNPEVFSDLVQLKILVNNQYPLDELTDAGLKYIPNLKEVEFSGNGMQKIDPNSFKANTKLESINLDENKIKVIPKTLFDGLTELKYIDLSSNPIEEIDIDHIMKTNTKVAAINLKHLPCATINKNKAVIEANAAVFGDSSTTCN